MNPLGKMLLILGLSLAAVGLLLIFGPKIPFLGRMPGDIVVRRGNFTFYFPLVTCIILSLIITFIVSIFRK